jgi:hypothetical protein
MTAFSILPQTQIIPSPATSYLMISHTSHQEELFKYRGRKASVHHHHHRVYDYYYEEDLVVAMHTTKMDNEL